MQLAKTLAVTVAIVICGNSAVLAAYRPQTAAGSTGDTSGPAVGTPIEPPTVVEKTNPHR